MLLLYQGGYMNIEKLSGYLLMKLRLSEKLDRVDYLKCKLGLELLLINLSKIAIIYTIAIFLGMVKETLAVHIPYIILRNFAFGVHSESSGRCTVYSLIFFILIPWMMKSFFVVEEQILAIVFAIILCLILKYAPGDSSKYIVAENRKKRLKKRVSHRTDFLWSGITFKDSTSI